MSFLRKSHSLFFSCYEVDKLHCCYRKFLLSPSFKFFAIFICQFMTNKMPGIKAQLSMQTKIENVSQQLRSSFSQLHNSHFFQNCCHFCWNQNKVCKNGNAFKRNEDCASVFLKWKDFALLVTIAVKIFSLNYFFSK